MSTSIENLRRLAQIDIQDHTAIFDLYVCVGRDIDYLTIKFGYDPTDIINMLEGYGERIIKADGQIDTSRRGRLGGVSRNVVEEFIDYFYPGISSENPQNDRICIEEYMEWNG